MNNTFRIRVGVVLKRDNRILIVRMHRDKGDLFVLPGGGLEQGEGIFECAQREVKEEANLDVDIIKVLYLKDLISDIENSFEVIVLGKILRGNPVKGIDPEDKGKNVLKEVQWVNVDKLKNINFHPKQLKETLPISFKNNFKQDITYLGKFQYPE